MKQTIIWIMFLLTGTLTLYGQGKLNSSVYEWEKLQSKKTSSGEIKKILKSPSRSLEQFEINAITIFPGKNVNSFQIEEGSDELIIIKEGTVELLINNKKHSLGEGSVIVVSSEQKVKISNSGNENAVYFRISFKPYLGNSIQQKPFSSFVLDWKNAEFKPSANGGRRNIIQQPLSLLKELEIHVTTLKEGLPSHGAHVHPDEEIILVKKGFVEETIKGESYLLGPGSVIFLTNDDLHGIRNSGKGECEYYAIRWLTADQPK